MISGRLGEVIKESRTLATHLNGSNPTETAVMEYRSDYLGRMQWIAYPDGEKITYGYDKGGQVISVTGSNYGNEFNYVTNILYDQYGQRTRIDYGNGTFTEYNYDPARRWLDTINTQNKWGQAYQNISYSFDVVGNVLGYENDCLDSVTGNYKTKQAYTYDSLYQLIKVDGETTYNPYQSSVPEFKSNYSQSFVFDDIGLGNMTSKVSSESITPQKTIGDNLNYSFAYNYDENYAHRLINAGDRYYKYDANGNIICEQDGAFDSNEPVSYHKINRESDDVYSTDYGWGLFKEDDKGGSGKANRTKYKRTYKWNERNQLISSVDSNYNMAYIYGQDGQRSNKYTQNSETLYFNKMWTLHTDSGNSVYGGQTAKNIYLDDTRIVTKLNSGHEPTYNEEYYKQYYYHSDHLGSASLITDYKGDEYQRIEYTPYGETWVEKTSNTGLEYLPYRFTAKEIDEETGLYYYGARYLDPRYSRWLSADPALSEYMSGSKAGMGGAYNSVNLNLYHYAGNNPVKYKDPDGKIIETAWDIGFTAVDVGIAIYKSTKGDNSGWIDVGIDVAAIIIPGVPAGLSKIDDAVKIAKNADKVGNATRVADKIVDTTKVVGKFDNVTKVTDKANDLHRPYIRKSTREAVENAAQKNAKGQFVDPNTGKIIEGKYDLGHKRGHEFRTEKAKAREEGLTQGQFNDRMNNPELYQIEDPHSNRGHKFEEP